MEFNFIQAGNYSFYAQNSTDICTNMYTVTVNEALTTTPCGTDFLRKQTEVFSQMQDCTESPMTNY